MDAKTCLVCGRVIEYRKKWQNNWDEIKYCSKSCSSNKSSLSKGYEAKILELLQKRGAGKTICPSEILPLELKSDKQQMEEVRRAARRLVAQGLLEITQKGVVVDPSTAKGAIRLKLKS